MTETNAPPFPQRPATRRRRTLDQRLELARMAESKAAARLARKARKVEKYESVRKTQERKLDTRRKIIAGALALEHILHDATYGRMFVRLLDTYVTRDGDRALFGLPPLPPEELAKALAEQEARTKRRRNAGTREGSKP